MWDVKVIDTERELYLAVAEALGRDIEAGILKPGDRLPTHRALAKIIGVAVSTISRAYAVAEARGLVTAVVGKGTFVADDAVVKPAAVDRVTPEAPFTMELINPLSEGDTNLRIVVDQVLETKSLGKVMQYAAPQGLAEHREVGASWINRYGLRTTPDHILLTAGGQHALFSTLYALFQPGDRVAVDALTSPGAKAAARRLGIRLEGVTMDSEGLIPEVLESLCVRKNIKGLYTVGRMQNPTNRVMSTSRKEDLARIIHTYRLTLIENDVYAFLGGHGDETLSAKVRNKSVYISSLSKAFFAGLRVAFVAAPTEMYGRIVQGVADSMVLASPFCAAVACRSIKSGIADAIIQGKALELKKRISMFHERLGQHCHVCSEQSMAAWVQLPSPWTGNGFEQAAALKGVQVFAAERFSVGFSGSYDFIRVSLSGPQDLQSFEQGLKELAILMDSKPSHQF